MNQEIKMAGWDDESGSEGSDIQTSTSTVVDDQNTQLSIEPSVIDEPLSNEDFVRQAYQDLFGREADEGGAGWWSGVLNNGGSRQDVISAFQNSDEYKALHAATVASTPEPQPQEQQLELWTMQSVQESQESDQVVTPPAPPAPAMDHINATMSGFEIPAALPAVALTAVPEVKADEPVEAIPSYNEMAKSYDSLTNQFTTLSQNGFDKYNELQQVLQTQGANSAAAIALQARYDQIISTQNVVIASLDQVDTQIWTAVEQKQNEAKSGQAANGGLYAIYG